MPPGLLLAVGQVESGRRDPVTGQRAPWPWTIDAGGIGRSFSDLPSALASARSLLAQGVTSIDIGCFQINLAAHPQAFASLEQAFDPVANANYAARFLTQLHAQTGSWRAAVAAYHSTTPALGEPYRDLVLATWGQTGGPVLPSGDAGPAPALRVVTWAPAPARAGVRVWTPSGAGPSVIHLPGAPAGPAIQTPG